MAATGEEITTDERQVDQRRLGRLIKLLAEEQQLSSTEIADTLWLALQIEPDATVTKPEKTLKPKKQAQSAPSEFTAAKGNESEGDAGKSSDAGKRGKLSATTPQADALPSQALPVWIADPAMLTDPLAIMRALKPLLRQVDAGIGHKLDESATVEGIARTQLWLPVLKAETEPWFDIVLVVDRSSSMHLWRRLVQDLERILRRYGVFRDLQVYDLVVTQAADDTDAKATTKTSQVRLRSHPDHPGHHPSELIEQRGRRIVIMLSDCTAPYWWNGQLLPMLQDWAKVMPTVVWQMLPPWMWERTALGRGKAVALGNGTPGVANQRLCPQSLGQEMLLIGDLKRLPVPVVTSEPDDLSNWSLMLAGDRRELTPGYLLPQSGGPVPKSKTLEAIAKERQARQTNATEEDIESLAPYITEIARDRIQRFLDLSSPAARRLVMLLAAAPVITLPVMRLIRDSMMVQGGREQSPLPVAEVFLSGLLQRVDVKASQQPEKQSVDGTNHQANTQPNSHKASQYLVENEQADLVQYDFIPKVRQLLLEVLPQVDTLDVLNSVSAAVEERWSTFSTQDFRAFLLDPEIKEPEGLPGIRSFANVTADILDTLGPQYETFANKLRQGALSPPEPKVQEDIEPEDDFEIPDLKILEFYRAEVREEAPPVQLVMDEFTVVTVEIESELTIEERLAEIVSIKDEATQVAALIELAPQLEGEPFNLLVRVMTVVQAIQNKQDRLTVLSALLPHLPDRLQGQVLKLIGELEEPDGPQLVEFEFEAARLAHQRRTSKMGAVGRTNWVIQRDRQAAYKFIEPLGDAIELEMLAIPAGTFMMGSPKSEPERHDTEGPQHEVTVESFCMGRYSITQAQWRFVAALEQVNTALETDPSNFKGDDRPVERVSWYEAIEFCDRLSRHTGKKYTLPSEAQWEYACRAGTQSPFHFGETISSELANYRGTTAYNGGPQGEYRQETTDVESLDVANAFGLCDMHGNVWEWCADHWHDNYKGAPVDGSAWISENEKANRVRRGGSWIINPRLCRSATRFAYRPDDRIIDIGFRVCCLAPRTLQPPAD